MLQHGSILVDDDQPMIAPLMRRAPAPVPTPATVRALIGRAPSAEELALCLLDAVHVLADADARLVALEPWVLEEARREAERYRDDAWTWRR
jgi:hypothetical protein